ncbi:hypothetical protein MLD38_001194 [Melastoma candidum]|uniref:Uncharacterized protein n=1 Tax=Melastoma candidum TaxID=119954 RepID=A0ACB9SBT4_9MYRT|nr:hypothetical protein MLD38_001194 [Melastoma candidum]
MRFRGGLRSSVLGLLLFVFVVVLLPGCESWGWFSSGNQASHGDGNGGGIQGGVDGGLAEFSMEVLDNPRGVKLVENARRKLTESNSCWQKAYGSLFAGCSEILATEEKRSRFAWYLTDCFQKDSGRHDLPLCSESSPMLDCRKRLGEAERTVYLEFYLETNSICHQLQTHAFKQETERLVNELKIAAESTEDRLGLIQEKSESLYQRSNEIYDSLISIDGRTQRLAEASKGVEEQIQAVLQHSEAANENSRAIAASQMELQQGQEKLKGSINDGMEKIQESYKDLRSQIGVLRDEAAEIEKEIGKVRDGMFSKMESLQGKADDIGNMAGISLEKQKILLQGQSDALKGLESLTDFQSRALDESRVTLKRLAEFSSEQQEQLMKRQEQLQRMNDHLVENSKSILAAQEAFESKQATMFVALDKLFALHNAMLLESRLMKSCLIYGLLTFVIYMFTSTKQTYEVRPWLYIGMCVTFGIEVALLRFTSMESDDQGKLVGYVRSMYIVLGLALLLYAILTYRNYDMLNHRMLLNLIEKVDGIRGRDKSSEDYYGMEIDGGDEDSWLALMDAELPEEVDLCDDPDYVLPAEAEEYGTGTGRGQRSSYHLRRRRYLN